MSNNSIRYLLMDLKGVILKEDGAVDGDGVNGGGSGNGNIAAMTVYGGREGHCYWKKQSPPEWRASRSFCREYFKLCIRTQKGAKNQAKNG